jgi:hypothetical protein
VDSWKYISSNERMSLVVVKVQTLSGRERSASIRPARVPWTPVWCGGIRIHEGLFLRKMLLTLITIKVLLFLNCYENSLDSPFKDFIEWNYIPGIPTVTQGVWHVLTVTCLPVKRGKTND